MIVSKVRPENNKILIVSGKLWDKIVCDIFRHFKYLSQVRPRTDSQTTTSKWADQVNFVLPTCERIPLRVETSERFLSVDGSEKRVARLAFDENIKKRNLLFPFNSMVNVLVSAVEKRQPKNCTFSFSTSIYWRNMSWHIGTYCRAVFQWIPKAFLHYNFHSVLFTWH